MRPPVLPVETVRAVFVRPCRTQTSVSCAMFTGPVKTSSCTFSSKASASRVRPRSCVIKPMNFLDDRYSRPQRLTPSSIPAPSLQAGAVLALPFLPAGATPALRRYCPVPANNDDSSRTVPLSKIRQGTRPDGSYRKTDCLRLASERLNGTRFKLFRLRTIRAKRPYGLVAVEQSFCFSPSSAARVGD